MPKTASRPKTASPKTSSSKTSSSKTSFRKSAGKAVAEPEPPDPSMMGTKEEPKAAHAKPLVKNASSKSALSKGASRKSAAAAPPGGASIEEQASKPPSKPAKRPASVKKARPPSPKTFLVAATRVTGDGATVLQVYAAVTRSPAEALAAVRAELGPDVAVELTGKLSNRMAKGLGLKPGALRSI